MEYDWGGIGQTGREGPGTSPGIKKKLFKLVRFSVSEGLLYVNTFTMCHKKIKQGSWQP